MKKVIAVCLLFCLSVALSGCVYYGVQYRCMGTADRITEIAVFDLRNKGVNHIDDSMVPAGYVDRGDFAAFVEEVETFPFVKEILLVIAPTDPSFYYGGYVVRITYADGSYELIGATGYQSRYRDGEYVGGSHYGCDRDRWNQMVLDFVNSI